MEGSEALDGKFLNERNIYLLQYKQNLVLSNISSLSKQ